MLPCAWQCSLPFLCWLLLLIQGGRIRAEGIWGARSHCSGCWRWGPWITTALVWEVINTVTQVQAWAPGMDKGAWEPRGADHCDLPPFPAVSVLIIALAASGAWLLIALTHYLHTPGALSPIFNLHKKTKHMLLLFQHGLQHCWWHSACLACREWVLPWGYWKEMAQLFLSIIFGLVLGQNPLLLPRDACAIKHLGTWSTILLNGI